MVWWILLILVVLLIVGLLVAPVELCINSSDQRYSLTYRGFFKAELIPDKKEVIACRMQILGWPHIVYPLRKLLEKKPQKENKEEQVEKKKTSSWKPSWKQIRALFREIKVKELKIDLDTGNWVVNAQLYPVFYWMNRIKGEWQVNFEHRNAISLHLRTQPYRLIKAMFNP